MNNNESKLAFAYFRLSKEEAQRGESSSITNQRLIVSNYCKANNIALIREFADDGYSGSNFDRPDFTAMLKLLDSGLANMVITKDLSRLGRDMRESSYYAEQYFPERQIQYIAICDNFDSTSENIMAPLQFAMNEVQLRECSRKIKEVLRSKRENGLYCARAPYGYKKDERNNNLLVPDEETAPVVQQIFKLYIQGHSMRDISRELTANKIPTPNQYRIIHNPNSSNLPVGTNWHDTTIKSILDNQVYIGHTALGRSKKVSFKSNKQISVPKDEWAVTKNTHIPLVDTDTFEQIQYLKSKKNRKKPGKNNIRHNIFSGIVKCSNCGYNLASRGYVDNKDITKYWWLRCTHSKNENKTSFCDNSASIKYLDLIELVRDDLNSLLSLSDEETDSIIRSIMLKKQTDTTYALNKKRIDELKTRIRIIDKIILKLYNDNANGVLSDNSLYSMIADLQVEANSHKNTIASFDDIKPKNDADYMKFFELLKKHTYIEELNRDILLTFIDKIVVEPLVLPEGAKRSSKSHHGTQKIHIFYKFIGEIEP